MYWSKADEGPRMGLEFIGLPYFPFFSNCRGFDSHIHISKMFESHPDCSQ